MSSKQFMTETKITEDSGKMMATLNKYASENDYLLVVDVSDPKTPILFAANTIDITRDLIDVYSNRIPRRPNTTRQGSEKLAVFNIQQAIVETRDGQNARSDLRDRFGPKQKELQDKQARLTALQNQFFAGQNTLDVNAKEKLVRDINAAKTSLNRDIEEANTEIQEAERKIMDVLGAKMMDVLNKYASSNGYALVTDVSNPQRPLLFASSTIDITRDIIWRYDNTPR